MNILYGLDHARTRARSCVNGDAGGHRLAARRDRARHRDGAPALHARPGHDRRREHRAGGRAAPGARCSTGPRLRPASKAISDRYGLAVDPNALVEDVTVGMQQRVEILKALYRGADILILDEPTAVLTPRRPPSSWPSCAASPRRAPRSSSSPTSSTRCSTSPTGSRSCARGKYIGTETTAGATEATLAKLMVGREVVLTVDKTPAKPAAAAAPGARTWWSTTTATSRSCAACPWRCGRGRSWAWPASTATARRS